MLSLLAIGAVADARSPGASPGTNPAITALPSSEQAAMAVRRTSESLARTTQALQAMRAAQNAARIAATAGMTTVPNGLGTGGLVVAPGAVPSATDGGTGLWQGAALPIQSMTSAGRTQVQVTQNQQKAILTWSSFNIGRETDLYFNQTAGGNDAANWIALNRVVDPGLAPSRILGTIKAEGQVYVINKNGIIFGGLSQVNVASLVASSLALSNTQFLAGINVQRNTGGSGYLLPQFGEFPANETGNTPAPYTPGNVLVDAGARIVSGKQGLVALFGSNVANRGTIETPSGQTLLRQARTSILDRTM
ncbi:MAG TPA: filamentous hemagglutinin N-terminal domain-containing protein [Bradyrhizobium sp.]|nr:filamentous hemagglutinin N-terminal domain-containing protein [Bradyrhizobium sp.]